MSNLSNISVDFFVFAGDVGELPGGRFVCGDLDGTLPTSSSRIVSEDVRLLFLWRLLLFRVPPLPELATLELPFRLDWDFFIAETVEYAPRLRSSLSISFFDDDEANDDSKKLFNDPAVALGGAAGEDMEEEEPPPPREDEGLFLLLLDPADPLDALDNLL